MKRTLLTLSFLVMTSVQAAGTYQHPSSTEIDKNRACFKELEVLGCRSTDEDHEQFRSCLSDVVEKLDDNCKKLMLDLYGE